MHGARKPKQVCEPGTAMERRAEGGPEAGLPACQCGVQKRAVLTDNIQCELHARVFKGFLNVLV